MRVGLFIEPNATPLANTDLNAVKKMGFTEIYVRALESSYKTVIPQWKAKADEAGLIMGAWTWCDTPATGRCFRYTKDLAGIVKHILVDAETYSMPNIVPNLKQMYDDCKSQGAEFLICPKPDGFDGNQYYDQLAPICDIIAPMLYLNDYGLSYNQLSDWVDSYSKKYPGKILPILESYYSDNNPVPKDVASLLLEVMAIKDKVNGLLVFRGGLLPSGLVIPQPTPTPTPEPSPDQPPCPVPNPCETLPTDPDDKDCAVNYGIAKTDFHLMIDAVANWLKDPNNNGTPPGTVYIRANSSKLNWYLTYAKYQELKIRWDNWLKANNNVDPDYICINKPCDPPQVISSGTITDQIQKATGKTWNNFTEFYNLVVKYCSYSYYYDDRFSLAQEIQHIIDDLNGMNDGQNCVDWCQAGVKIAQEEGYGAIPYGIWCPGDQVNHAIFLITGKEFIGKTTTINGQTVEGNIIDLAAASSDNYGINTHWCNGAMTKQPAWIPYE